MNLFAWVFMPNQKDLTAQTTWPYPTGYVKATRGQMAYRKGTDQPMNNTQVFEPGWKRCAAQDTEIGDDAG